MAGGTENSAVLVVLTRKFSTCAASLAGPALIAVAHPTTVWPPASSFTVWFAPFVKLGALLMAFTLMVNVCAALVSTPPLATPPSSCTWTVTVADPFALAAGVKVSVPLAAMAGGTENSAVLVVLTRKFSACPASLAGPALIAAAHPTTVWPPASSFTVWFAPFVKLGALLMAFTLMVNVCAALVSTPPLATPPSSCTWTVTVADPFALAAGVKVSVPLAAMAGGTENSAELVVLTRKFSTCAASLAGPALIAVAHPTTVWPPASSFTVWFAPFVKLGTSFTALTVMVNFFLMIRRPPRSALLPYTTLFRSTVADPFALAAGVKVSVPLAAMAGGT